MSGFLAEIGSRIADRWMALLVVPGLLYLAVVTTAIVLGQGDALGYPALSRQVTSWAASQALKSVGGTVLLVAALLIGSVAAGLAAATLGRLAELAWVLPGERRPARWLAGWRRQRSRNAKAVADDPAATRAQVLKAMARADRICLIEASRPTWIGDRLHACQVRVRRTYGLDLNAAWPRLWLVVPDIVRAEISTARDAFSAAARLTGWAVLYLVLAIWWWPAVPVALVVGTAAVIKARLAVGTLADLIESAVDLYGRELAAQLGDTPPGSLTQAIGRELTTRMRKDRWDPSSPLAD